METEDIHHQEPERSAGRQFTETESEAIRSKFMEYLRKNEVWKDAPPEGVPLEWLWKEFRRENDPAYRFDVAEMIFLTAENTPENIREVNDCLNGETGYELRYLIALAGKFRSPECLEPLLRVLKNETNALAALDAIRRIKDPRAESALDECLASQKPEIRLKAQRTRRWIEEKTPSSLHAPRYIRPLSPEFAKFLSRQSDSFSELYPALENYLKGESSEKKVMLVPKAPEKKGLSRFFQKLFGEKDYSNHRAADCFNLYYTSRMLHSLPSLTANRIKEADAGFLAASLKEFQVDVPFGWKITLPPEEVGELVDEHQWKKREEEDTAFILLLEGDFEAHIEFEFISTDLPFLNRLREQIGKLNSEAEQEISDDAAKEPERND